MERFRKNLLSLTALTGLLLPLPAIADQSAFILDTPDYTWHTGCFGTASGNLMGYWDRNGFPNFYTGPTAGGVAPLNSFGENVGIHSMWASQAGLDGRPADQPGHVDDYWDYYTESGYSYESAATDPYVLAGRAEHAPDCLGDFIGASQNKWADLDGECAGNIDAFSFNFWDKQGHRRENYIPENSVRDVQSGWQKWAQYRGYKADVYSQLVDFNTEIPPGTGFTFEDMKAEIDAGYPVMLFLQNPGEYSRPKAPLPNANPLVHGMVAYGYVILENGIKRVRYRTSWGSGDRSYRAWTIGPWEAGLALRGVVGFHPIPKITSILPDPDGLRIKWDGPSSRVQDISGEVRQAHWYVIEKSDSLEPAHFTAVTDPTAEREIVVPNSGQAYYRVRLLSSQEAEASLE